jgi:hypothetical protein
VTEPICIRANAEPIPFAQRRRHQIGRSLSTPTDHRSPSTDIIMLVKSSDWITLAAVVVAGFAALLTYLSAQASLRSQERTSRLALTAQRDLAIDDRLWQKRAETYIEILTFCTAVDAQIRDSRAVEGMSRDRFARIFAFSSPSVTTAFSALMEAIVAMNDAAATDRDVTRSEISSRGAAVRSAVRTDLSPHQWAQPTSSSESSE